MVDGGERWCIGEWNDGFTDEKEQIDGSRIARLILAGNSLTVPIRGEDDKKPVGVYVNARKDVG